MSKKRAHHIDNSFDQWNALNFHQGLVSAIAEALAARKDNPCNLFNRLHITLLPVESFNTTGMTIDSVGMLGHVN